MRLPGSRGSEFINLGGTMRILDLNRAQTRKILSAHREEVEMPKSDKLKTVAAKVTKPKKAKTAKPAKEAAVASKAAKIEKTKKSKKAGEFINLGGTMRILDLNRAQTRKILSAHREEVEMPKSDKLKTVAAKVTKPKKAKTAKPAKEAAVASKAAKIEKTKKSKKAGKGK